MELGIAESVMPKSRIRDALTPVLPWIGFPAAGALWAAWHLRNMYFFYDEWSMVHRVMHRGAIDGMTASFNGHLWMLEYWMYRIQVSVFGVDSHFFISACLVVSVVALHLSIVAVLRACGVRRQLSLLVGGLLAYLGTATQNWIFTVQASLVLSMAIGLFAAAIVLRSGPSSRAIVAVAVCLASSAVVASATAVVVVAFAGVVAALRWKLAAVWAVTPALVILIWWFTTADLGQRFPASFDDRVSFATRLTLQSVGAVVGRDQIAGAMVSGVVMTLIVLALVCGWLDSNELAVMIAGLTSAVVTVATIAQARAGLVGSNFTDFNRYLSYVAIPLVLAATPALLAVARRIPPMKYAGRFVPALPTIAVVIAFCLGLSPGHSYASTFEIWNEQTRRDVVAATVVIDQECPSGITPDPASLPTLYNPQITTQLLRELIDRGALTVGPISAADPAVTARMCELP